MWWHSHIWVIVLQIIAFVPYIKGSNKFYRGEQGFLGWIVIGIVLDIIMTIAPPLLSLPRMQADQVAPWSSLLFITHIATAGSGMFGFIAMALFVLIKGKNQPYPRLAKFQYRVLFPLWIIGVAIALVNFFVKVVYGVRLYDYL